MVEKYSFFIEMLLAAAAAAAAQIPSFFFFFFFFFFLNISACKVMQVRARPPSKGCQTSLKH
jgi:hypothetical protein